MRMNKTALGWHLPIRMVRHTDSFSGCEHVKRGRVCECAFLYLGLYVSVCAYTRARACVHVWRERSVCVCLS